MPIDRIRIPLLELYVRPAAFRLPGLRGRSLPVHSMTFKNKITMGFGAALTILILVGVVSFMSLSQNGNDRAWVTHTYVVLETLEAVLTNLTDAETGQRG